MAKIRNRGACLVINAPDWYRREDFRAWLNGKVVGRMLATWHNRGEEPTEYSDVFVTYDNHEGSDSDMPEPVWKELCRICDEAGFREGVIWLTNLDLS